MVNLLPLYLEDDALALYLERDEDNQNDIDLIEACLKEAFTDGVFTADGKLTMIRWAGERVDVYRIKQLAGMARF